MTEGLDDYGTISPANQSPQDHAEFVVRIPKNKSTGNLLASQRDASVGTQSSRTRFSFDSGNAQEISNLKKAVRSEHEHGLATTGLRRIRRAPSSRAPTLIIDDEDFIAPPLLYSQTLPVSGTSSRSVSRSASTFFVGGPSSPVLEDVQRFPAESLHSFSFARQSEDFLHSRQAILEKSVDFLRDHKGWMANPGLVHAQAKVSGDSDLKDMMDLLRKAKVLPSLDIKAANSQGLKPGPLTGPANFDSRNMFEKSFGQAFDADEEAVLSPTEEPPELVATSSLEEVRTRESELRDDDSRPDSPAGPRKLRRTYTDVKSMSLQRQLIEALAQPYSTGDTDEDGSVDFTSFLQAPLPVSSSEKHQSVHTHSSKWTPPAQVVFRTEGDTPWTIVAANDLACLTFGVTRAEVRSLSILGLIQPERRDWLEQKLQPPARVEEPDKSSLSPASAAQGRVSNLSSKGGITARLLSKAPSRTVKSQRAQADDNDAGGNNGASATQNHPARKSRGVMLCGEILPIQKRDGRLGAASFWAMEKMGGIIWVVQEVIEDIAYLEYDSKHKLIATSGDDEPIWGEPLDCGVSLQSLLPRFPLSALNDATYDGAPLIGQYTACTVGGVNVPAAIAKVKGKDVLRVSSLPHIAGVMFLQPDTLKVTSSNSAFSANLFGYDQPNGLHVGELIPNFETLLEFLTEEDDYVLLEGLVIPEFSFRRARALQALRDGKEGAASIFLRPAGLPAKHRDGTDLMVDVQMKIVRSETFFPSADDTIPEEDTEEAAPKPVAISELVYALWITYSRQLHSAGMGVSRPEHPLASRPATPPAQPPPPESIPSPPPETDTSRSRQASISRQSTRDVSPMEPLEHPPPDYPYESHEKKRIDDFVIIEDMGSGAYGEVKLARYRSSRSSKRVIKYVTKKKILVDTWTRDRRLGTVPLEIHVLDFLRRPGMQHPNIVEMVDFFEDNINYYIEMLPHGIPGVDLFDYIELRTAMQESEARDIFGQVVSAIYHLHVKAQIVHRDVKDENVVLDGENKVKLIDFGSAAYIKNGPFDVFVGTIDYAAPEVLQGKAYGGTEQDVWALGILLYTIVFKENPFYNIDEILDHPLRLPPLEDPFSDECIDLIQAMLNRDVDQRYSIEEVQNHPWLQVKEELEK